MVREIVIFGDPVLRKKCSKVESFSKEVSSLVKDMIETMVSAEGIGLAAPQIGIPIQLAVIDVSHDPECISYLRIDGEDVDLTDIMPLIFINPELEYGENKDVMSEGCLSFPEIRGDVIRPYELKVTFEIMGSKRVTLETDGLLARAIQHETDHLNGVLFTDRMKATAKLALRSKIKRMQKDYGAR
jgi:peptide deformylase